MFCHIIFDIETDGRNLPFHLVETIFFLIIYLFIYFLKNIISKINLLLKFNPLNPNPTKHTQTIPRLSLHKKEVFN